MRHISTVEQRESDWQDRAHFSPLPPCMRNRWSTTRAASSMLNVAGRHALDEIQIASPEAAVIYFPATKL